MINGVLKYIVCSTIKFSGCVSNRKIIYCVLIKDKFCLGTNRVMCGLNDFGLRAN